MRFPLFSCHSASDLYGTLISHENRQEQTKAHTPAHRQAQTQAQTQKHRRTHEYLPLIHRRSARLAIALPSSGAEKAAPLRRCGRRRTCSNADAANPYHSRCSDVRGVSPSRACPIPGRKAALACGAGQRFQPAPRLSVSEKKDGERDILILCFLGGHGPSLSKNTCRLARVMHLLTTIV